MIDDGVEVISDGYYYTTNTAVSNRFYSPVTGHIALFYSRVLSSTTFMVERKHAAAFSGGRFSGEVFAIFS